MLATFERNGFVVVKNALDDETVSFLIEKLSKLKPAEAVSRRNETVYGVRNLLNISPEVKEFSEGETVGKLAENFLDERAKIVRAIYFDKNADANWKVPWHQDLTISVKEKRESKGFSVWTMKAKIQHVQPPVEILEKMVTLRFHLDDADETNGALKVIPKSHTKGRLSAAEIKSLRRSERKRGLPRQTRRLFNNAPADFAFVVRRNKS